MADKPESKKNSAPMPLPGKHPLRYAITGDTHFIAELKEIIQAMAISEHLKAFLGDELDEMKSNAAEIHLHLVDQPQGGGSLLVRWSPRHIGIKPKPASSATPAPVAGLT